MFSKTKEADGVAVPQPQTTTVVPPPAKRPVGRGNGVPSIISAEVMVTGMLISAGDIQVDGRVEGDIRAGSLIVGEHATISGDVYADDAIIRGRVEGSIHARRVQLCATCHVEGNILHEALSVETGAFFEGNCRHSDNPLADAPEARPAKPHVHVAVPHPAEPRKMAAAPSVAPAVKPVDTDAAHAPRAAANFAPLKN